MAIRRRHRRQEGALVLHLSRGRVAAMVVVCLIIGSAGCSAKMASKPMAPSAVMAQAPAEPAPLDRSLFSRDPNGQLAEDALQRILAAPIELDLPSRVGVLPIHTATDWRGPGPDDRVPAGVANFVEKLRRDAAFSLVTQTMVIPSGALGMEALREVAARYRLRYLLLYREVLARADRLDVWAIGYATLVGALFLPGKHQEVYGYIEASMFDVKTGLLMFTTRRAITASQRTNEWHTDVKHDQLAARAVSKFSPELATDVLADLRRFAGAAEAENLHRRGDPSAPLISMPPATGPSVATDSH
jgi:hypothetical protein